MTRCRCFDLHLDIAILLVLLQTVSALSTRQGVVKESSTYSNNLALLGSLSLLACLRFGSGGEHRSGDLRDCLLLWRFRGGGVREEARLGIRDEVELRRLASL